MELDIINPTEFILQRNDTWTKKDRQMSVYCERHRKLFERYLVSYVAIFFMEISPIFMGGRQTQVGWQRGYGHLICLRLTEVKTTRPYSPTVSDNWTSLNVD